MKTKLLTAMMAATLLAATPMLASAQAARPAATAPAAGQQQAGAKVIAASERALTTLQSRRTEFRNNPVALRTFIDSELNSIFDRDYAARLVLGVHGRGASEADIKLFADAMADNLMQRYGSALLEIQGNPKFRLKSESPLPGNRGVKVSTELLRAGSESTPVDYLMRNVDGQWKIFDVMIEGISYVQTFKNQFDTPLRQKSIKQVATELRSGSIQASGGQATRGK